MTSLPYVPDFERFEVITRADKLSRIDPEELYIEPLDEVLTVDQRRQAWQEYCSSFGKRNEKFFDALSDTPDGLVMIIPFDWNLSSRLENNYRHAIKDRFGLGGMQSMTQALSFIGNYSIGLLKGKDRYENLEDHFSLAKIALDESFMIAVPTDVRKFFKSVASLYGVSYHGLIALRWLGEYLASKIDVTEI